MNKNCEQCKEIWTEYSRITHEHFQLESKLQIAGLQHDHDAVKMLLPQAQSLALRRSATRRRIEEHERTCHPGAAAGMG